MGWGIDAPIEAVVRIDDTVGDFVHAIETDGHLREDRLVFQMAEEDGRPTRFIGGLQHGDVRLNGHVLPKCLFWKK